MVDLDKIKEGILKAEVDAVKELVQRAVDEGQEVKTILNEGLIVGMRLVGDKFEQGDLFLPEMIVAARAMKEGLEVLKPLLRGGEIQSSGRVILGTVKGDIHDIGKGIVGIMLEGGGFMVSDIGTGVDPAKFVEEAREENADLIGVSALLTTTMAGMKNVVQEAKEAGLTARVMVGGASVTREFADEIGAVGYAPDAPSAVREANELMKG